ncbi:NUDIX domain-containing protein [Zobellia galactanivorans]|uniref:NUDIX hydrolase n=1 Tax=Zobellia galactanivorans (strain DSM 12802 / CCUG 47099 / CIP 106680 / NCIMB 13871 / Dsij) TaxID=63186 RepID=G0KZI0_ZOBGA|nr:MULTISPECIES: NUDIX domain-containing protein [Zobellia]MBU3024919.1 NUDIX domain-containing protein [Zobellia galactanivorans]MDO6808783.1 NUDIX domain-containing protein [Zobellia galactanivorans]OWW25755.1 NUDIX hydrolase [Zobellia sp. OII3]CAZ98393.1 NUDIX hydrolase [Zobellia galactanivorans]
MEPEKILNISVDCVVFGYDINTKSLNVLLIKRFLEREEEVLVNDYVLTGYHVYQKETLDETATRVLKELTGLTDQYKKQFKAFGNPDRLTNEKDLIWIRNEGFNSRTITIAYYFLLKTDDVDLKNNKYQAKWFPVNDLPELGFDHEKIILEAYEDLKTKCLSEPIIFKLLPDKFTINEVQDLYQSILGIEIDNRNFRRKLIKKKYIIALDEKQVGVSKRPAQLYMFSLDLYEKMFKKNYLINI